MDELAAKACQDFLRSLHRAEDDDPDESDTWGYYVYLTYPVNESEQCGDGAAILTKIENYLVASLTHTQPDPYSGQIIAALHLTPVTLHSASLSAVRAHFRTHLLGPGKHGPRYRAVLVVDAEALASVLAGPEPVLRLPAGKRYWGATEGEGKVFVKALQVGYDEASGGEVHLARGRGREGAVVWEGCLKVCPRSLMELWGEVESGGWEALFLGNGQVWDGPE